MASDLPVCRPETPCDTRSRWCFLRIPCFLYIFLRKLWYHFLCKRMRTMRKSLFTNALIYAESELSICDNSVRAPNTRRTKLRLRLASAAWTGRMCSVMTGQPWCEGLRVPLQIWGADLGPTRDFLKHNFWKINHRQSF